VLLAILQFVRASVGHGDGRFFGGLDVVRVLQWRTQYVFHSHELCVQETRGRRIEQVVRQPNTHATNPRQPPGRSHPAVRVNQHTSTVRDQNEKRNRPSIQRRRQVYGMKFITNNM